MGSAPEAEIGLIARSCPGLLEPGPRLEPIRVVMASLALGGAERIVAEWLSAEARSGRACELATLHGAWPETPIDDRVARIRRGRAESREAFFGRLGQMWGGMQAPASAHLISREDLERLARAGIRAVPALHNDQAGWRDDPAAWDRERIPFALACSESAAAQARSAGCRVPMAWLRHEPEPARIAASAIAREEVRRRLRLGPEDLLLGMVGSLKAQKRCGFALEILAQDRALGGRAALALVGGELEGCRGAALELMGRARELGVQDRLRLLGFREDAPRWMAGFDALLQCSSHEGYSMALREALACGLPALASDIPGSREALATAGGRLLLEDPGSSARRWAERIRELPERRMEIAPRPRLPRAWSAALWHREPRGEALDVLFATANLNAGGAQRSLANLCARLAREGMRIAVAVGSDPTAIGFARAIREAGCEALRLEGAPDPLRSAEGILALASRRRAGALVFWNADPKVKLCCAKMAPPELPIGEALPGGHADQEMEAALRAGWGEALGCARADWEERLDGIVAKHAGGLEGMGPRLREKARVIRNGVEEFDPPGGELARARFLALGRIAPTKRLERILAGFARARERAPGMELEIWGTAEERHAEYLEGIRAALPEGARLMGEGMGLEPLRAGRWTALAVLGELQGCPNAALEAAAFGVALIGNDSGGTREIIRPESGILLPEEAGEAEVGAAMLELALDPERARRLGEGARELVRGEFGMGRMAREYREWLGHLRERARRRG